MANPVNNDTSLSALTSAAYARQALLPAGFRDQLFPAAEQEFSTVRKLLQVIAGYGYERVSPPLVEYEESLLMGPGSKHGTQMFRLMDPESQRVMAVRADMTVQVSRMAATRLQAAERPLRLAYAGNVLRVKGSQVRPTRQFMQAGFELIGSSTLTGTLEVMAVAVEALEAAGIDGLSIDLTTAPLIGLLIEAYALDQQTATQALEALSAKDASGFDHITDTDCRSIFIGLVNAAGPADTALEALKQLPLSGAPLALIGQLDAVVNLLKERLPNLVITVDPGELHGFEYKTGIGFAVFARGIKTEIGRGGQYQVTHADGSKEPATGFSVYMDTLMQAVPEARPVDRIYIPCGADMDTVKQLRTDGFRTIQGLTDVSDTSKEAQRLGCTHVLENATIVAL